MTMAARCHPPSPMTTPDDKVGGADDAPDDAPDDSVGPADDNPPDDDDDTESRP